MIEIVKNNLTALIECTTIGTTLLASLIQKGVISKEFKEELEMETGIKRSGKMYAYLMDKVTLEQIRDFKESLENTGGNRKAFAILNNTIEGKSEELSPIWFEFKENTKDFVGREEELDQFGRILSQNEKKVIVLSGLGGIGKSELVQIFAKRIQKNVNCAWLQGESPATLSQSINKLANQLRMENTKEVLAELIKVADKKGAWLFVLDNVDEHHEIVLPTIRQLSKIQSCLIIITSRLCKLFVNEAVLIELRELKASDAESFVQQSLKVESSEEVSKLCETLHNLPLALQQAMAFIRMQQIESLKGKTYGIQDYLKEYEKQAKTLLAYQIVSLSEGSELTTLTTWNVTINEIRRKERIGAQANKILCFLAYLHPDGIPVDFLNQLLSSFLKYNLIEKFLIWMGLTREKVDLNECLGLLKSYSLVRIEDGVVDIHRLVQKVIQIDCSTNGEDKAILNAFAEGSESPARESYLKYDKLRQLLTIWNHLKKDDELTITFKYIPVSLSYRLRELGLYSQMLQFSKETVERFERLLPGTDPDFLRMQSRLGSANYQIGENGEALRILEESHSKMKVILGEEAGATLNTANTLALVLNRLKRFGEAEALYQSMLDSERKLSGGKDNQNICTTKHNLAAVLVRNGKYSRGMELLEEVLEWERSNLGEQHPTTLSTKNQIGFCHFKQGNFLAAKEIWEEVLKSRLGVLGDRHPNTLRTKHDLALAHMRLGQIGTALGILEEVLPHRIQVLGDNHPDTLNTKELIEFNSRPK